MPTTGLATFEEAFTLVTRHDLIVEPLLGVTVVQVVVDDLVAERRARHRPFLERRDRFPQRRGESLRVRLVSVALERRRQLEPVLDPVETGRDQCGEREIRVHVAAGNPGLDALGGSVPDDAEAARPVVVPPGERRRRPASGRVALVRVDGGREKKRELARARDPASEELLEHVALAGELVLATTPNA